jgi:hypothetical protein
VMNQVPTSGDGVLADSVASTSPEVSGIVVAYRVPYKHLGLYSFAAVCKRLAFCTESVCIHV